MTSTSAFPLGSARPRGWIGPAVALLALVAGSLWVLSYFTGIVAAMVPVAAEQRWTAALWREVDAGMPPSRATQRNRLADVVARIVERHGGGRYPDFRVGIIVDERAVVHGLPGGLLLVTTGMLDLATSENALAYVLAHEIAHLRRGESLRALGRMLLVVGLLDLARWPEERLSAMLIGAGLLADQPFPGAAEAAADRFALEALMGEYGHVNGPAALLAALGRQEGRHGHMIESPRRMSQRSGSLRAIAHEEDWPSDGDVVPWPIPDGGSCETHGPSSPACCVSTPDWDRKSATAARRPRRRRGEAEKGSVGCAPRGPAATQAVETWTKRVGTNA